MSPPWDIGIFGGPTQIVPNEEAFSAVDHALQIGASAVTTNSKRYLTKLRRVFEPEEMVDDLVLETMDYTRLLADDDPNRIAQAATQLGRHRDPAGEPALLAAISPAAFERAALAAQDNQPSSDPMILSPSGLFEHAAPYWHLRSCIWALGEIAVKHTPDPVVEAALLRCAQSDIQLIRMEAYTALVKVGSRELGPRPA